jgi:hypothetical protein
MKSVAYVTTMKKIKSLVIIVIEPQLNKDCKNSSDILPGLPPHEVQKAEIYIFTRFYDF